MKAGVRDAAYEARLSKCIEAIGAILDAQEELDAGAAIEAMFCLIVAIAKNVESRHDWPNTVRVLSAQFRNYLATMSRDAFRDSALH